MFTNNESIIFQFSLKKMHKCLQCLWFISLYGIMFFIFVTITMTIHPQYYDFEVTPQVRNGNAISTVIYALIFVVLSIKWRKDIATDERANGNIELRPLKEVSHHDDEEQLQ